VFVTGGFGAQVEESDCAILPTRQEGGSLIGDHKHLQIKQCIVGIYRTTSTCRWHSALWVFKCSTPADGTSHYGYLQDYKHLQMAQCNMGIYMEPTCR